MKIIINTSSVKEKIHIAQREIMDVIMSYRLDLIIFKMLVI